MKKKFLFFYFILRFGAIRGLLLYTKFKLGKTKRMNIKNIKYPIELRNIFSDKVLFYSIFIQKEYNIELPFSPEIIIDAGANIGLFTIVQKDKYPDVKIICIEPDEENFSLLERNTRHYSNIYHEKGGIWNKNTFLKVFDKYNSGKWGLVVVEDEKNGTLPAFSIDAIMKKYSLDHIDILKLDIETSEKQVFSENYDSWLSKVRVIIIELHDYLEPNCAKTFFDAIGKVYSKYELKFRGENIIVINLDFDNSLVETK